MLIEGEEGFCEEQRNGILDLKMRACHAAFCCLLPLPSTCRAPSTDPTEMLLLDVTSFGTNVLAAATFSEIYSNNTGNTFYSVRALNSPPPSHSHQA